MRLFVDAIVALLLAGCGARTDLPIASGASPNDGQASSLLLFGGIGSDPDGGFPTLGDTWSWTAADGWTELHPANSPSPRFGSAAATVGAATVLFGGDGPVAETWVWDGKTWAELQPSGSPPAVISTVLATQRQGLVLFDGYDEGVLYHDVWTWDGSSWSHPTPAITPPAREAAAGAVLDDRLVIFGGQGVDLEPLGDTWIYDGVNWTQLSPVHSPSPRRAAVAAALDGKVILFGGDTLSPTSGGWLSVDETWIWDGADWTQAEPAQAPDARSFAGMATVGGRVVLFGGGNFGGSYQAPAGTWTWDGAEWTKETGPDPEPRNEPALAAR